MLVLPSCDEPLRVMGVDPGTSCVGIGCLDYLHEGGPIAVTQALTLFAKDNQAPWCNLAELHGTRTMRLMNLASQLQDVIHDYQPHAVVVENNYLRASVDAFRSLVESVCMVRNTLYSYNPLIPLHMVDPTTVKKLAGVKGKIKDKDKKTAVREALRPRTDLTWMMNIDDLDEHSIDAIAIALYFHKSMLAST